MSMDLFSVVAEPNRRAILAALRGGDRSVGELVDELSLSQPMVSKHLGVLRTHRFVDSRSRAQQRLYRLRPDRFQELDEWLEPYRAVWASRLDALEARLDRMEDE
jgi:DNA-binding transcriptional ArsR family regulator